MTKTDKQNWIDSYPTNLSLRHLAETFEDKQREQKLRIKQMIASVQNEELFKIKTAPQDVFFDVVIENMYTACNICCPRKAESSSPKFCADILDPRQLFWLRSPSYTHFIYPKLLQTENELCIDCSGKVSNNKEFHSFLDQYSLECEKAKHKHYNELIARKTLLKWSKKVANSFTYVFSSVTFKIIGLGWYFLSRKFMQKLIVSSVEIEEIKTNRDPIPVLYVVKNQTKFDWFIVLFILFFLNLKPPIVFLPNHLKSRFSWIYRKLGISFLKLPPNTKNVKNTIYEEFWYIYAEENFKIGNHIMFYMDTENDINGGNFILESAVDSLKRSAIGEIYIAPVIVNYEKNADSITEKKLLKVSMWSIWWDIIKKKAFNFGFVKIEFISPYSLTKMLLSIGTKDEIAPYNISEVLYDPTCFSLTCKIWKHLAFDFCRSETIMSTNLISFLLLKKFRGGITLDDFVKEVDEFRSILKIVNKRVGFTGTSRNIIKHAVDLLGSEMIVIESNNTSIIRPVLELPYITDLCYYSDVTLRHFMIDAILLKSVATLFNNCLQDAYQGNEKELKFYYQDLVEKIVNLCDILQAEYIFEKPCKEIDVEIGEIFFKYVSCNYFTKVEKMLTEEEKWACRYAKHLELESESESEDDDEDDYYAAGRAFVDRGDKYLVNYQEEASVLKDILFYRSCLKPIIDTYIVSAESLNILIGKQMVDSVYYKHVIVRLHEMFSNKSLEYLESISVNSIRNSMNLFKNWDVVRIYIKDGIKLLFLTPAFDSTERIANVVKKLKEFQ